ncbi:SdpI family protein [Helcococcus ovis]|uniref:SdpI family protein n=3 Tax=Helcococcus ovis TaxID=72026 RepID=UPI00107027FD|nr:SdpI family protein [Helcococcus ovis]TFF68775.1 SdpI family protein [Helcococcus ovis]WNZ01207.1 SdpI family protein [Helcococcus ovis]
MLYLFNLLVPVLMIILGILTKNKPIKKINSFMGYRTELSMKSQKNWEIGQKLMGKVLLKAGIYLLFLSIIFIYIVEKFGYDKVLFGIFMIFQSFYFLFTIPIIELQLKKEVDEL